MRAAIYREYQGPITIEEVPDPSPADHGVIVRVTATGLCRSDWHGWMGHDRDIRLPHVPGHELSGIISAAGSKVTRWKIGDRVTTPFVCACGACPQCHSGNHQVCDHQSQPGFTHWGSFAEYVALDYADTNLVALPPEIDDVTAATLGCRFITSYRAIVDQGRVRGGQYVAVHGCGGVGLSAIMIAVALGAQVIAIDINDATLQLARSLGAMATINAATSVNVIHEVNTLTHGGAHVSLDALGSQVTSFNSIACLRKRGRHIQVGLMTGADQHPTIPMDLVIARELQIVGSHGMQAFRYPDMLDMIKHGILKPRHLVSRRIHLDEVPMELPAMDKFDHSGVIVIDRL